MELDDFKNTSPQTPEGMPHDATADPLGRLIRDMKQRDQLDTRAMYLMVALFFTFVVIYSSILARKSGILQGGYALLVGGFLYSLVFFLVRLRSLKKINYAAPVREFLRRAERRYAYWPWQDILTVIPATVAMAIGGGLIVDGSFQKYFPGSVVPVLIYAAVFVAALGIGHFSGKKMWLRDRKELYERIRALRAEFEATG